MKTILLTFISVLLLFSCGEKHSEPVNKEIVSDSGTISKETLDTLMGRDKLSSEEISKIQHEPEEEVAQNDTITYNQPWLVSSIAIMIDPYYGNSLNFSGIKKDRRVVAILHKASENLKIDSKYLERRKKADENGILYGSYHLGKPQNPIEQADFYLSTIGESKSEVMALDLEGIDGNKFMSLKDAEKFIARIKEKTGKYPLIYANNVVVDAICAKYNEKSIFAKCPLWYARFKQSLDNFPTKVWKTYTFWQFSCELNCKKDNECLYNIEGTHYDIDINVYNGSMEELKNNWKNIGKE